MLRAQLRNLRRRTRREAGAWRQALRAREVTDVLVERPVFVFSSIRSGSTLLRMVLDRHPDICAPHEMHLTTLEVSVPDPMGREAIRELGLDEKQLQLMLWDRVLLRELARSGKSVIVDKTPKNTRRWRTIAGFWPEARYVFLLRHPLRILESMAAARPDHAIERQIEVVNGYAQSLHDARRALPGFTVRYEDFTEQPEAGARDICNYLGVGYDPSMLRYKGDGEVLIRRGLGDWSSNIRSGRIRPAGPPPAAAEIPEALKPACELLGYL
jgi:hypothetical protein